MGAKGMYIEYDYKDRKFRLLSRTGYDGPMGSGRVEILSFVDMGNIAPRNVAAAVRDGRLSKGEKPSPWDYVMPGSFVGAVYNRACSIKR